MYAIVEISGKQFKVKEKQSILVDKLNKGQGENIDLHNVYLIDDGKNVTVGTPTVSNVSVKAKVLGHQKGDKVVVFKKKRRKGFATKNGHRQQYTHLLIEKINSISLTTESATDVNTEKPLTNSSEPEQEQVKQSNSDITDSLTSTGEKSTNESEVDSIS